MKKLHRKIMAADAAEASPLSLILDELDDDYKYAIAGLEKLDRMDSSASDAGYEVAQELSEAIQAAISQISDIIGGAQ